MSDWRDIYAAYPDVVSPWEQICAEAEDIAQRIVDEIGHPVTDEPALGPSYRAEIDRLRAENAQLKKQLHSK